MFRIGKKQAFKTLRRSDFHQTLSVSQLVKDTALREDTVSACKAFVCNLYSLQRTRWLAAKQKKLGTGSSVRRGRRMRDWDYLQRQTASVSI